MVDWAVVFLLRDSLKHNTVQGWNKVFCLSPVFYKTSVLTYIFHLSQLAEVLSGVPEDPLLQPFWEMKDPLAAALGKSWAPWGVRTLNIQAEEGIPHQELTQGLCIPACSGLWRSHGPPVTGSLHHVGQVAGWEAGEIAPAEQTVQNNHCSLSRARGGRRKANIFSCARAALLRLWRLSPVSAAILIGQRNFSLMTFPTHH